MVVQRQELARLKHKLASSTVQARAFRGRCTRERHQELAIRKAELTVIGGAPVLALSALNATISEW